MRKGRRSRVGAKSTAAKPAKPKLVTTAVQITSVPVPIVSFDDLTKSPRSAEDLCRALDYADKVPEHARAAYINNVYAETQGTFPEYLMDSHHGVDYAFRWSNTPEGHSFWNGIHTDMIRATQDQDDIEDFLI